MNVTINLQNHMAGAEQALRDLEASIGMYQANLGAPSNETSRVAIDGRKESGETSVSHFPNNLSASVGQVGRICIQMTQKLIDTKRQQRILGFDSSSSFVTVDPEQTEPTQEMDNGISINPSLGTYDVRIVIGTNYATQRSQAQTALAEIMRTSPNLTPAIAPIWAMNLDIPNAEKLSQVLTAMAPPQIQEIMNPDQNGKPKTEELIAKSQQLEQQLAQASDLIQRAGSELQQKTQELESLKQSNKIDLFNAETNRMKVTGGNDERAQSIAEDVVNNILSQHQEQQAMMQQEQFEQAPIESEEEKEPEQPSPDVIAILGAMSEQTSMMVSTMVQQSQTQLEGQAEMAGAIVELANSIKMPVKKTPIRDKLGNISHVMEERTLN
jgi:hypothetical protein